MLTACRVVVEEVAFFSDSKPGTYLALDHMDNPDVWHEVLDTWTSLGDDRVVPFLTPDNDHNVGLMAGASAAPLWIGGCDTNGVCDVVPNGSPHRFESRPKGDRHSRVLDEERFSLEADGPRAFRGRYLLDAKGRQRPFPILDAHVEPAEGIEDGSIRDESGQVEGSKYCKDLFGCQVTFSMAFFGRIMEASSVLHVVGDRSPSRNVSFASSPISRCWRVH